MPTHELLTRRADTHYKSGVQATRACLIANVCKGMYRLCQHCTAHREYAYVRRGSCKRCKWLLRLCIERKPTCQAGLPAARSCVSCYLCNKDEYICRNGCITGIQCQLTGTMQEANAGHISCRALPTFTVCSSLAKALVSFSERGGGGAIALPPALAKNPRAFLYAMLL